MAKSREQSFVNPLPSGAVPQHDHHRQLPLRIRLKEEEKQARLIRRQQGREAALALENGSATESPTAKNQPDASLILDKNMGSRKKEDGAA